MKETEGGREEEEREDCLERENCWVRTTAYLGLGR